MPSPTSSSSASIDSSPSSASSFSQLPPIKQLVSWTDSLNKTDWQHYKDPQAWAPPVLAVGAALGFSAFYRSYLRRIPSTNHIQPRFFRRRSLLGRVTSVGDGDNFHLYHTPGGWLAGWGWLRKVPSYRKDLKGKTVSQAHVAFLFSPHGSLVSGNCIIFSLFKKQLAATGFLVFVCPDLWHWPAVGPAFPVGHLWIHESTAGSLYPSPCPFFNPNC